MKGGLAAIGLRYYFVSYITGCGAQYYVPPMRLAPLKQTNVTLKHVTFYGLFGLVTSLLNLHT